MRSRRKAQRIQKSKDALRKINGRAPINVRGFGLISIQCREIVLQCIENSLRVKLGRFDPQIPKTKTYGSAHVLQNFEDESSLDSRCTTFESMLSTGIFPLPMCTPPSAVRSPTLLLFYCCSVSVPRFTLLSLITSGTAYIFVRKPYCQPHYQCQKLFQDLSKCSQSILLSSTMTADRIYQIIHHTLPISLL